MDAAESKRTFPEFYKDPPNRRWFPNKESAKGGQKEYLVEVPELEAQAKVAVDAFERNGFFVLVDRRQAVSLDDEVDLASASDVTFVKLIPLVGG